MKLERVHDRLAIVGFCNPHREWVPYDDEDLEIWGLNRGYVFMEPPPAVHKWFEMHGPNIVEWDQRRPGNHVQWLQRFPGPVVMHQARTDIIPNSIDYPLKAVAADIGASVFRFKPSGEGRGLTAWDASTEPYLSSTIAQELALAIHLGYHEIWLYGIDLNTAAEYAWQKPGVEHMLGLAAGRGIRVFVPDMCPLLKGNIYGRGYLRPEGETLSAAQWDERIKALQSQKEQIEAQLNQQLGARREIAEFVIPNMPPGIDAELIDQRRQKFDAAINQTQAQHLQLIGALTETLYWAHQTPDGQDPKAAIHDLEARYLETPGLVGAEGPQGIEADLLNAPSTASGQYEPVPERIETANGHVEERELTGAGAGV